MSNFIFTPSGCCINPTIYGSFDNNIKTASDGTFWYYGIVANFDDYVGIGCGYMPHNNSSKRYTTERAAIVAAIAEIRAFRDANANNRTNESHKKIDAFISKMSNRYEAQQLQIIFE